MNSAYVLFRYFNIQIKTAQIIDDFNSKIIDDFNFLFPEFRSVVFAKVASGAIRSVSRKVKLHKPVSNLQ